MGVNFQCHEKVLLLDPQAPAGKEVPRERIGKGIKLRYDYKHYIKFVTKDHNKS